MLNTAQERSLAVHASLCYCLGLDKPLRKWLPARLSPDVVGELLELDEDSNFLFDGQGSQPPAARGFGPEEPVRELALRGAKPFRARSPLRSASIFSGGRVF